jgi:hypothetical protein
MVRNIETSSAPSAALQHVSVSSRNVCPGGSNGGGEHGYTRDASTADPEHAQGAAEEARDEARRVLRSDGAKPPVNVSNRLPLVGTITLRPE